jgi:osmotically inducible protein OsmC
MPKRTANARWEGSLTEGNGTMRMASGAYEGPYSFQSRFEEGDGTNPEELIAAAHAACFSMALANVMAEHGHPADSIRTTAKVHLRQTDAGPTIQQIELETTGTVPGIDQHHFAEHAEEAKAGCPVSRALAAVDEITVDAKLVS